MERHRPHFAEVGRTNRLVHVMLAQSHDPVHRQPADARGPGEGRLGRQQEDERFEEQREAGELVAVVGLGGVYDRAAGQRHTRNPHVELALVLE